ncbi:MAG: four helix bundle protein [Chthoniobacterales bacterium]
MPETVLESRTKEYARRIIRLCSALPRGPAARVLGDQLLRSGTSIGANYREAMRSRSKAEFIAKLGDSLKEASESEYWLELLSDESFLPANRLQPLLEETREITAMLIASIKTARSR